MGSDTAVGGSEPATPQVAVGAVCVHDGRLLVIERAHDPGAGRWSLPGGRVEAGEALADALAREVSEETGLAVDVGALCGIAERIGDGYHFVILDFWVEPAAARAVHGTAPRPATASTGAAGVTGPPVSPADGAPPPAVSPGDDSSAARWVTRSELSSLPLVAGLDVWLADHGVLAVLA